MKKIERFVVGIDEVGRGPLAGPVCLGAVIFLSTSISRRFVGVKDSKKLSIQKREEWFDLLITEKKRGKINYSVSFSSQKIIDTKGLSFAIQKALAECLKKLNINPKKVEIFLDGGLKAPKKFLFQKTIIKGDEKIRAISLASIAAKVMRDRRMVIWAKKYPQYGFEIHKGYGTALHRKNIKKHGISPLHRKSFLKNF